MTVIEVPCLAARAFVLSRLGRHDGGAVGGGRAAGQGGTDGLATRPRPWPATTRGWISLAAGRHAEAAQLLEPGAGRGSATVNRPAARLARAEALARSGHPDEATAEVRGAALGPGRRRSAGRWALVSQMARVQGLIALARGNRAEARRRLNEAAEGWRLHLGRRTRAPSSWPTSSTSAARRSWASSSPDGNCAASPPNWPGWTSSRRCSDARIRAQRAVPGTGRGSVEAPVRPGPGYRDWGAGIETVRRRRPRSVGPQWPTGYPDFPMPQKLRVDRATRCSPSRARSRHGINVWQLAEAGTEGLDQRERSLPESEAHRLDGQQQVIQDSLRRLTALAEATLLSTPSIRAICKWQGTQRARFGSVCECLCSGTIARGIP